ncbi:MAG: hypothetical protein GTN36_01695 [Candidatus Aenigmarchaeota archaeon]|nr:hypothetical protein [Candidatus Aenigmarchaeota archaeon]
MKKLTENIEKTWAFLLGFLIAATPALANPIESMVVTLRDAGFQLVLLWLLSLAVVYGILSHIELPKSITARGVISIVASFLVLIAAAGTQAATFLSTLTTSAIVIGFTLIVTMIFFEITKTKEGGEPIFSTHPHLFSIGIIVIAILVFVGAGGLNFIAIPAIAISQSVLAIGVFLIVMVASVWILVKETGESK